MFYYNCKSFVTCCLRDYLHNVHENAMAHWNINYVKDFGPKFGTTRYTILSIDSVIPFIIHRDWSSSLVVEFALNMFFIVMAVNFNNLITEHRFLFQYVKINVKL